MNRWLFLSIALTVAAFAASGYVYLFLFDRLPEQMPTHWNIRGEPDQFMPRAQGFLLNFLLSPGLMVLFLLLTLALPWLSPAQFDIERFRPTYDYVMFLVVALAGFIQIALGLSSFFPEEKYLARVLVGGLLLFFSLLGNVMGQVKRNFYVGVRVPWTLASEKVWNQTHRFTAWLWVPYGLLAGLAVLLIPGEVVLLIATGGIFLIAVTPILYSLVLYKRLQREGRL